MTAHVDRDRPVLVAQQSRERIEHTRAEPVGVLEQQRRSVATPVERGDLEAVVTARSRFGDPSCATYPTAVGCDRGEEVRMSRRAGAVGHAARLVAVAVMTLVVTLLAVAANGPAHASEVRTGRDHDADTVVVITGDVRVPRGDRIDNLFVIDGDVRVDGIAEGDVFVVNGDVVVEWARPQ